MELILQPPRPWVWRLVFKLLKLIACAAALFLGWKMLEVGVGKLNGDLMEAWEEKFVFFSALLSCVFVYVSWQLRKRNGLSYVFAFTVLAIARLAALAQYEWRWFAHATTCLIGMFIVLVAISALISVLERRT